MSNYTQQLAIYFLWHPSDNSRAKPIVDYCFERLYRNSDKPFSRGINMPVFLITSNDKNVPSNINFSANNNLLFVFNSEYLVIEDSWIKYLEKIKRKNVKLIPFTLDKTALDSLNIFETDNHIRYYNFDQQYALNNSFITIAHEIYRFGLTYGAGCQKSSDNVLELFLSHTKKDSWALKFAEKIKDFIDNSTMQRFFDASDILIGNKFDRTITKKIEKATLISIHSDNYSSRYWCQREIIHAKNKQRPMICVDHQKEYEDRRFPFASNVPSIHVQPKGKISLNDIYSVLEGALIETLRVNYHKEKLKQYKNNIRCRSDIHVLIRPPELSDIENIIKTPDKKGNIIPKYTKLLYPEPPVYKEEQQFLSKLGIKAFTPLTIDNLKLTKKKVGISISNPCDLNLMNEGLISKHLKILSIELCRHILYKEGVVVYGGDLRTNGFTEFMLEEASAVQSRLNTNNLYLENYLAWPLFLKDKKIHRQWKTKYNKIAKIIEIGLSDELKSKVPNINDFLLPNTSGNRYIWSCSLTNMRKEMIEACDFHICAGGKLFGYLGRYPGVLEEILITIEQNKPLYLLGGFAGVTSKVCRLLMGKPTKEITLNWQSKETSGYTELVKIINADNSNYNINYDNIVKKITDYGLKRISNNNGLSESDNKRLFITPFIDEAIFLIFKGLKKINRGT